MPKKVKTIPTRKQILTIAIVLSLIMYLLGVFSGLFANKIMEQKVEEDIEFLKNYNDVASLDLKNMLLQQLLIDQLPNDCKSSNIYLENLRKQLDPYWQKLPARLEAYDKTGKITPEYISLKREYIRLSLRIWLLTRKSYEDCNSDLVPILYFYDKDCQTCTRQGEIFDQLKIEMEDVNKSLVVFPIDQNFEDDNVYLLKEYYNITSVPSVIIKNKIISGDIISLNKLIEIIED